MMKLKNWIAAGVFCAICCLGIESSYAQKMFKQGEMIVLDCGPGSGFPQGAVELQRGKKIAVGTPSDTQGPMANNRETESINATVYHKVAIDKTDASGTMTWSSAYQYCREQGDGLRLPTQRELQLMWIFKSAIVNLGGAYFVAVDYWCITEEDSSNGYFVSFRDGHSYAFTKTLLKNVRCVREL